MKKIIFLAAALAISVSTFAQQVITEGKLVYNILLDENQEPQGTLTVLVKNNLMKREMTMKNGFSSIIIYDASTGENKVYNDINGTKISKVQNKAELLLQNKRFENATYLNYDEMKTIAGLNSQKVTITYKDDSRNIVFTSDKYKVGIKEFYSMFDQLQGIPTQYEVRTATNTLLLKAVSIEQTPVSFTEMAEPKGYKVFKQ